VTVPTSLADRAAALAALNREIAATPAVASGRLVPGEGPIGAAIALVGEQPGDVEDQQGRPFVGPAGRVLDEALAAAGIDRDAAYLTNAVKRFKFNLHGKRRLHARPSAAEVAEARGWLIQELTLVGPRLVIALGATAALALAGHAVPVMRARGPLRFGPFAGFVTVHPSFLLRMPDEDTRHAALAAFVSDLRQAAALLAA
jgi:DNA polymerase